MIMAFATLCFLSVQGTETYLEFEKLGDIYKKVEDEDKPRVQDLIRVSVDILKLEFDLKNASALGKEMEAFDNNLNELRTNIASVKTQLENLGYRQKRTAVWEQWIDDKDWYLTRLNSAEEKYKILNSEMDSLKERQTDISDEFLSELARLSKRFDKIKTDVEGFNPSQKRASAESSASLNGLRQATVKIGDLTSITYNAIVKMEDILTTANSTMGEVKAAITGFDEKRGEYESALKSIATELEGMENIVNDEKSRRAPST